MKVRKGDAFAKVGRHGVQPRAEEILALDGGTDGRGEKREAEIEGSEAARYAHEEGRA